MSVRSQRLSAAQFVSAQAMQAVRPTQEATVSAVVTPATLAALDALRAEIASALAPTPATATEMPAQLAGFWASDYQGKAIPVRQLANGRWVDVKGAFCKAPAAKPAARKATAKPAAKPGSASMTVAQFAALHPEVMSDLAAAVLGTVFTTGGSWSEFRTAILGR